MKKLLKKLPDIKNRLKNISEKPRAEEEPCKNCGAVFSGHYCPECGQSVSEVNRPFSIVFYDFLGNIFAFDTRFWTTFIDLIFRPGFLTKEFFAGRRARYAPPMRFFIFASFVLFLLLQILTNRGVETMLNKPYSEGQNIFKIDSTEAVVADSVFSGLKSEFDTSLNVSRPVFDRDSLLNINFQSLRNVKNLRDALSGIAIQLEEQLAKEDNPEKRAKLINYINLCHSPELAISRILKYMSWAFFLLLPVFALILKLFYIRKNQYYVRHLVFSIHIHTFVFLIFILIISLLLFFNHGVGWIIAALLFTIPVYFIIALKKFYRQSVFKVILKFLGISFLYNTVFWLVITFVFINALGIV